MKPIIIRTLTPLWTGGIDRDSSRPRETGLLGSLRWWYEGIVRGMGGRACDPVGDDRCEYDARKRASPKRQLCPACWLFGCTGWQRRFRLYVDGLESQDLFFVASSGVYQAAGNWLWRMFGGQDLGGKIKGRGAAAEFEFSVQALWGDPATLQVTSLAVDAQDTLARVTFLLDTITRWGALGAKPQHGFGQIEVVEGLEPESVQRGKILIEADTQAKPGSSPSEFFNLGHFFSHVYQLAQPEPYSGTGREIGSPPSDFDYRQHFIPCAFDIRYKSKSKDFRTGEGSDFGMRPWFRAKWGNGVTQQLFGRSDVRRDQDRSAGRIFVSHLFRKKTDGPWYLKVWGHVPSNLQDDQRKNISVDDVTRQVSAFLNKMFPDIKQVQTFDRKEVLGQ